jgi:hypothetical protein
MSFNFGDIVETATGFGAICGNHGDGTYDIAYGPTTFEDGVNAADIRPKDIDGRGSIADEVIQQQMAITRQSEKERRCALCNIIKESLLKCGGCKDSYAYYCSKEHQKEHWKIHKTECESLALKRKSHKKIVQKSLGHTFPKHMDAWDKRNTNAVLLLAFALLNGRSWASHVLHLECEYDSTKEGSSSIRVISAEVLALSEIERNEPQLFNNFSKLRKFTVEELKVDGYILLYSTFLRSEAEYYQRILFSLPGPRKEMLCTPEVLIRQMNQ